jgi:hypothetical protein
MIDIPVTSACLGHSSIPPASACLGAFVRCNAAFGHTGESPSENHIFTGSNASTLPETSRHLLLGAIPYSAFL